MVTFSLGGKDYGIDIMKVKEIAKFSNFTYVPNTPQFVRGVYNLRGDIISVIDLRGMFQLSMAPRPEGQPENGLILRLEDRLLGVVVDDIDKVVGIDSETIQPPHPIFGDINIKYISGVVEYDGRLYIILDVERIFSKDGDAGAASSELPQHPQSQAQGQAATAQATGQATGQAAEAQPASGSRSASQTQRTGSESVEEQGGAAAAQSQHGPQSGHASAGGDQDAVGSPTVEQPETTGTGVPSTQDQRKTGDPRGDEQGTDQTPAQELEFVVDSLTTFGVLHVSDINRHWVEERFQSWSDERRRAGKSVQFETQDDALEFLHGFFSPHTGELWSREYLDSVRQALPDLTSNTLNVWNPGCGTGYESYSFAVLCRQSYPDAQIKIWASDNELLSISTAPNLVFQLENVPELYENYMVSGSNGYSFNSEIKDAIVFEYHDVTHETSLPELDLVLMRDLLSVLPVQQQLQVAERAVEGLRQDGVLIAGAHEDLSGIDGLEPMQTGVNAYRKVPQQGAK
jgi:purine-binding chemotaxis protein CheW